MFQSIINRVQTADKHEFLTVLNSISDSYYNSSNSPLTDKEFDTLVKLYEDRFEEYNYLGSKGNCKLPCYMPSLNKAKDDHVLSLFKKRCGDKRYIITDKVDGYSLLMVFKEGEQPKLYNRGDGEFGTDVSDIYKYINKGKINLEKIKKLSNIVYVRGELVMDNITFEKYKGKYNNPRNLVAGVINSKERDISILKDIKFIAYSLPYFNYKDILTNSDVLNTLEEIGFYIPYKTVRKEDLINENQLSIDLIVRKEEAEYDIDGLVITPFTIMKENSIDNPKFAIAFKMLGEVKQAKVIEVEWNVSKTNALKPRIKIKPVMFGSITVQHLTGFNAKYIKENNIGKGTMLSITRSGDVIPHILSVITSTEADLPTANCHWRGVDLISDDDNTKTQFISRMITLFEKTDIKGMKEGILTKLYESGITTEHLLFNITKKELLLVEGIKDKSASNILECIQLLKNKVNLCNLMVGSCIFVGFGEKKISKILSNVEEVNDLILKDKYTSNERLISKIESLGGFNKTAKDFVDYLDTFKEYYEGVKDIFMLSHEMMYTEEQVRSILLNDTLKGKSYCFSGVRDKVLEGVIISKGGVIADTLTKAVTYLVVLDINRSSSKIEKAKKYGVNIISIDNLKKEI
jgi:DNA ligase (NAD+)